MSKFCKNCGGELKEGSNFCAFCGANNEDVLNNNQMQQDGVNLDKNNESQNVVNNNTYSQNTYSQNNQNNGQYANQNYANNVQGQNYNVQNQNGYYSGTILSLVFSIIGLFCFGIPLGGAAIGAGIYSLAQIKKTGEKGKILAIFGIIIGIVDVVAVLAAIITKAIIK